MLQSHDNVLQLQKKMEQIFTEEAARTGARAEFEYSCGCRAYELAAEDPALIRYQNACRAVNITPLLDDTFGGSDAANLVRQGISAVCMLTSSDTPISSSVGPRCDEISPATAVWLEIETP